MRYTLTSDSPIHQLELVSDGQSLIAVKMLGQRFENYGLNMDDDQKDGSHVPVLQQAKAWLEAYFANPGTDPGPLPALDPKVTPFRREVCEIMATIPYGQCITHGDIAKELERRHGKKMTAQAVGGAVGHNPIGIIIPCHRVIGASNKVTGYGGGVHRKLFLLKLEGVDTSKFIMPAHDTI